jgi:uncharacterized membrane protein
MTNATHGGGFLDGLRHRTRHLWSRPSLSFAACIFLFFLLASPWKSYPARDLLLAFNLAAVSFIAMTLGMMSRSTPASLRQRAERQREGRWVVLATSMVVALTSLVALSLELHTKTGGSPLQVLLSVSTIVLVWGFVNTIFALHYAHDYYDGYEPEAPGLAFPGSEEPDYWDFMYFAFVLGMTFQVSDVQITSRAMRRFALLHGMLAFIFNVVIIALTVNIIAGLR